jgi:ribosomal protein S18 acetylase RimI-like enzyme
MGDFMHFATHIASNYMVADLVALLNQGFEDYFIQIQFTNSMFLNMLRKDGIDLSASRVLLVDDTPGGIALIAPRGARRVSRLAAMGLAKEYRGKGAGSWFMKELIGEACQRGDREMVLEVIEQNEPAVKLYRNYGFESVRRLVGYTCKSGDTTENGTYAPQEIDLHEVGQLISQYGLADLPWQLSGESIVQMTPPVHTYRWEQAYIALSNPEAEHVVIWSLLVEPQARGQGMASEMLKRVLASYTGKTWHVPALCPEELGKVFERAGFEKEKLSQWQMKREL